MPKRLLRGVIDFEDGKISREALNVNFQRLQSSNIEWPNPEDERIYGFVLEFFRNNFDLPTAVTLQDFFLRENNVEVQERLKDIGASVVYVRKQYSHLLEQLLEDQNRLKMRVLLKDAEEIVSKGRIIQEGKEKVKLQGVKDAMLYFNRRVNDLIPADNNVKLRGDLRDDTDRAWQEYQIAKRDKGKVWGCFTGINEIDRVCHGCKRGEMWVHAAFVGELKCLPGDATVFDHKTQRRRRLEEMFACGDLPTVTAIADEGRTSALVLAEASHLVQNGMRQVYDLTLKSGRRVGSTDNHRFLTLSGWRELKDLKPGDFVATPKVMHAEGHTSYTEAEVKLVGYLIGDGRIEDCINFTQENEEIREDFVSCLKTLGLLEGAADYEKAHFSVQFPKDRVPFVRVGQGLGDRWHRTVSPVRVLLERTGLYGKDSYEKRVPSEFFGLPSKLLAQFLGALWSTDGSCSTGIYEREGQPSQTSYVISYNSVSQELCLDVQSLLLRLGIQSTVTSVTTTLEDGRPYVFWTVRVVTNPSKRRFCKLVHVVGKSDRFQKLAETIPERDTTPVPSALLPDGTRVLINGSWRYARTSINNSDTVTGEVAAQFGVSTGDIFWDRVQSIEPRGVEMTYDLSVPGPHTFVTNDIVTHNTTFALNWCYNLVTHYKTNVFYVSIEMPYEQVRRNIYAIHSTHSKFKAQGKQPLSYSKIRDGELSPEEEAFYQEVLKDFNENPNYCRFEVWQPSREVTIADIRLEAELKHKEMDVGFVVIDHGGRVQPRTAHKDYTIALNTVLSDAKLMAMHFNGGEGVPVLMLFQLNRQGKTEADKNEGKYKLNALSYANEAERSADYVTTSYLNDQHREAGTTIFCNLKNRDNALFQPFTASVRFTARRITNFDPEVSTSSGMRVDTADGLDEVCESIEGL